MGLFSGPPKAPVTPNSVNPANPQLAASQQAQNQKRGTASTVMTEQNKAIPPRGSVFGA